MKPVDQSRFGDDGDCFAAALASILELPLSDVPDFIADLPAWSEDDAESQLAWARVFLGRINGFLAPLGLFYFEISTQPDPLPRQCLDMLSGAGYWVGIGPGGRGYGHAVVFDGLRLAHDPHPSRKGIELVHGAGVLCALDAGALCSRPRL